MLIRSGMGRCLNLSFCPAMAIVLFKSYQAFPGVHLHPTFPTRILFFPFTSKSRPWNPLLHDPLFFSKILVKRNFSGNYSDAMVLCLVSYLEWDESKSVHSRKWLDFVSLIIIFQQQNEESTLKESPTISIHLGLNPHQALIGAPLAPHHTRHRSIIMRIPSHAQTKLCKNLSSSPLNSQTQNETSKWILSIHPSIHT